MERNTLGIPDLAASALPGGDTHYGILAVGMFDVLTQRLLSPPAFGLDISDLTVKVSRFSSAHGVLSLEYFGETAIPEGIVVGGEIKREPELSAILQAGLRTSDGRRIRERYCIASLPEEKSFVRIIELPKLAREDVAHAVRWEVEGIVPLPIEEIFFDFELIPSLEPAGRESDVLITAFPRNIIESYHRVITHAGFIPLALELESQAISRAVVARSAFLQAIIIVDIGATRTSFIMFGGGSLIFTKSITVGGHDFETAIANTLSVSRDEARRIKIEAGLNKNYHGGRVFEALAPFLSLITRELRQQLSFYQDHPTRRQHAIGDIERVVLCGGDANLIGLEKYIGTTIKKFTVLGNPFINLRLPAGTLPPIPKNQSLKYTTAIGSALGAMGT